MLQDRQAHVLAAANAAASWIRVRRTLWDDPRLDIAGAPADTFAPEESRAFEYAETAPVEFPFVEAAPLEFPFVEAAPLEALAEAATPADAILPGETATPSRGPSVFEVVTSAARTAVDTAVPFKTRAAARAQSLGRPVVRALPAVFIVAVLVTGVAAGYKYWSKMTASRTADDAAAESVVARPAVSGKPTGKLEVTSEPTGARVRADGIVRGVTPLTLEGLAVGVHSIVIESGQGSVQRSVSIKAGKTAQVTANIFAGFLTVFSPFEITITEGTRAIRLDEHHQVMLPSGPHQITMENTALGYRETRRVDMRPGETTTLSVVPPRSTIRVTASEPADVVLDGMPIGRTPLDEFPADLGTRELMLTSASGEVRRLIVTLTARPAQVNVDFSKPAP